MKKKTISAIPYMHPQKADKKYLFVAAQKIEEIAGEEHLFIEIFNNTKEGLKLPKLRMVFTKKDWCLHYPEANTWSSASFLNVYGDNTWESGRRNITYMSEDDQNAVWKWCGPHPYADRRHWSWTRRLEELISNIRYERRKKRDDARRQRLKEREENTPPLPSDLTEWADKTLFRNMHFLYYKRHGRYADICCSCCGKNMTVAVKRSDSLEGQFEKVIDTPKNNLPGLCPSCGAYGTWKAEGKTKGVYGTSKGFYIGMPYKGDGAVIRYLECEKIFSLEESEEGNTRIMTGASEKYIITEIARKYVEKGKKKTQTDLHKYSPYTGENFWDDCNLAGMTNILTKPGIVYEGTWEMLKGTVLQYSGAEQFQKEHKIFNLMDYMERYTQFPQMEMLSKMGLYGTVEQMVKGYHGLIANKYAKCPEDFLGIHKNRVKLLINKKGDTGYLNALKLEHRMNAHWTDKQLFLAKETEMRQQDLELAMEHMSMQQLLNKIEKYSGCEIPEGGMLCGRAAAVLKAVTRTYFDYLNMRQQRGYDLNNKIFLWPRNLQRAHDLMVEEVNQDKINEREKEVSEKYPNIRKNYRKWRNQYFFEDEEFLIRPARSAEEIVREGRMLHHCVGGNMYLDRHNEGRSIILFLRAKAMPETPYITVEIQDTKILQWYGNKDTKPEKETIQKWLDNYLKVIKERQQAVMIAEAV